MAKADQDLTFETVPDKVYGDEPFTMLATSNRNLHITYTSSSPSKVSVSRNTATIKGANRYSPIGQYTITLPGGYDKNYSLTLKNGTLTIIPGEDGINGVMSDGKARQIVVYSLSGQFVRMVNADEIDNLKHLLSPGIYIVNGKKVLVK